jgi:hypothetical protein
MKHNIGVRLKRAYAVVTHSPDSVELRYGVWNPTSFHLTDEYESGNLAKLLIHLGDFKTASQLAEITDVPRGECEALLDHLVELGVVEDAPTTALDHYIDHIIPALKSAPTDGLMRPILLLGDPVLMAEIERHLTATSSLLDVRTNCDQNLSSIIKGRREPHLLDGRISGVGGFSGTPGRALLGVCRNVD